MPTSILAHTAFGQVFPPDPTKLQSQTVEDVIEPTLPIIDAHHHLWDRPGNRYLLEEFTDDLRTGHNVIATVAVECQAKYRSDGPLEMRPVGETEYVASTTASSRHSLGGPNAIASGIVGFADLMFGERVRPVLEEHIRAGDGRFRGVRFATGWDVSEVIRNSHAGTGPHILARPDVRLGVAQLSPLGLSLDVLVFHTQLEDVIGIAQSFPELSIVVGHAGSPLGYGPYEGAADKVFASWRTSMRKLANCPNITVKLGGLLIRLAAFDYLAQPVAPTSTELARYWRPYMESCIEYFGADRCMFESNFPVEKMATGYATLWNALKRIAAGASEREKQLLFNGTARRIYRLDC